MNSGTARLLPGKPLKLTSTPLRTESLQENHLASVHPTCGQSSAGGRNWGLLAVFRAVGCGGRMPILNFISCASDSNLAALLSCAGSSERRRPGKPSRRRKLNRLAEAPTKPLALCGASLAVGYKPQIQPFGPPVSRKQVLAGPRFALGFIVSFSFFSFIFISWRLITLQYYSGICHTLIVS